MEKIYKNIETDTIENILNKIEFDDENIQSDIGTLMTIDEFIKGVNNFEILDYLGYGILEIDGRTISSSESWIFCKCFKVCKDYIISFNKLKEIFGNRIQVLWIEKK